MTAKTLSIAPMMDWTDRHFRMLMRQISKHAVLYTEMVTTAALRYGDVDRHLRYHEQEHPIILQIGGSDPSDCAHAARLAQRYGYDGINLNVGCPSDRVQSGRIGACLMAEPETVGACVSAMQDAVQIPVSVKTRIGIDAHDSLGFLLDFVDKVHRAGCETFIIHARVALLKGLSPKQNREVPPLHYEYPQAVKMAFPECNIQLNGGIKTLDDIKQHWQIYDGLMIGRQAYYDPYFFAHLDKALFKCVANIPERLTIMQAYMSYIESQLKIGVPLKSITRHCLNLFNGQQGAKAWRRHLSENAHKPGAGIAVIEAGLKLVAPSCDSLC